jgi:hypothetical protein
MEEGADSSVLDLRIVNQGMDQCHGGDTGAVLVDYNSLLASVFQMSPVLLCSECPSFGAPCPVNVTVP